MLCMLENCIVIDGLKKTKSGSNNSRENFDFGNFLQFIQKMLGVFCLIAILLQIYIVPKSIGGVPERYDLNLTILPFSLSYSSNSC